MGEALVKMPAAYAKMMRVPLSAMTRDELAEIAQFLMELERHFGVAATPASPPRRG